jgi:gentisate 1,2-dioxygenase
MLEAPVLKGEDGIYSAFYRLPKGTAIRTHRHVNWVQVMVVTGAMSVFQNGRQHIIPGGGFYVVPSGGVHSEEAVEDTLVLVTSPDP